ncbi:MAG: hypothetical protein IT290_01920 [Deltaproteobacteria bacterium]|nr:hypothetical protein [Deltaproteobacteria bacterium]
MQFLILAYDHEDPQALERRMAARPAHVALGDQLRAEGKLLMGVAILNEEDQMIGSMIVADFPSPEELDAWLNVEPYVTENVWDSIEIAPCQVGQSFLPK